MSLLHTLAHWVAHLRFDDIPPRVVGRAVSQVISQLAASRTGLAHPLGQTLLRAFGPPFQPDPGQGGAVLAGLSSWLQMDDTAYAGHLSNSTVNVALTHARALGRDGRALVTAVVAANETAARITAAATLGPFRGQSATYTHLAGSVAARLHLEGAPPERWVDALALAFGMPPRVLGPAFAGSDTKLLHAFTPIRAGMDACAAAEAGLRGLPTILEHPEGFLSRFSSLPLPEAVTAGLGTRWHTETVSYKMHPTGPGVDAVVDCAIALARELGRLDPADITSVTVATSYYTYWVDRWVAPLTNGPASPLVALTAGIPYPVATALLTGAFTPADLDGSRLADTLRWDLAARVTVEHDEDLTRASFEGEVPFGEALRLIGPRAAEWEFSSQGQRLGDLGLADLLSGDRKPSESFETARKRTGARVTVRLTDGRTRMASRDIPLGAAGPHTRDHHYELVREKFRASGGDDNVAAELSQLAALDAPRLARLIPRALGLAD
jgi:2-methylcitrate dehydratase PrpD